MKILKSSRLNEFFNEFHNLKIQTAIDDELLKYWYKLYNVESDYRIFRDFINSKYDSEVSDQADLFFKDLRNVSFNSMLEILSNEIYIKLNYCCESNNLVDNVVNSIKGRYYLDFLNGVSLNFPKLYNQVLSKPPSFDNSHIKISDQIAKFTDAINDYTNFNEFKKILSPVRRPNYLPRIKQLYKRFYCGKDYVSLDLKSANFQILKMLKIVSEDSFQKFIAKHSDNPIVTDSKKTRQIILGNTNPNLLESFQKRIMLDLATIVYEFSNGNIEILSLGSDEIIVNDCSDNVFYDSILKLNIKYGFKFNLKVTRFKLDYLEFNNAEDIFYKTFPDNSFELVGFDSKRYPQIYKLFNELPILENDLKFEDRVTKAITSFSTPDEISYKSKLKLLKLKKKL